MWGKDKNGLEEHVSIKVKIRNIILMTILMAIVLGCVTVFFLFVFMFQKMKTEHLKNVMDMFYNEAVIETGDRINLQSSQIAQIVEEAGVENIYVKEYQEWLDSLAVNSELAFYDVNKEVIFTTDNVVFQNVDQMIVNNIEEIRFGGSEDIGVWYYKLAPIFSKSQQLSGYVVVASKISHQIYVERIRKEFQVDATVFWKDVRVATTISENKMVALGTKLGHEVSDVVLSDMTTYIGRTDILGEKYITAYKSFGNVGEEPIGIVFVGEALPSFNQTIWLMFFAIGALGVLLSILTTYLSNRWLEKNVVKPMLETTTLMTSVAEGNLCMLGEFDSNIHYREFEGLMGSINRMILQLEESKKTAENIAYFDLYTGLPNRFSFFKKRQGSNEFLLRVHSVIMIDIDDLNIVNDIYGREIGDQVILEISRFLNMKIQEYPEYKLFRITGGTFAVVSEKEKTKDELKIFLTKIMNRFRQSFEFDDISIKVTVSIGVALIEESESLEELYQHSEIAMKEVKNSTKNDYQFYLSEFSEVLRKQKELEDDMKSALENGEFYLVYQPKYHIENKSFDSFEALIRWNSPTRGFVSPAEFIDVAERSGLIVPIGNWVLKEACRTIKYLSEKMNQTYRVAVNISPVQINREDFFKTVIETILFNQLDSKQLELEITENLLMTSFGTAVEKLRQLNIVGVSVSVDDFGKGYSSLAYLQTLPIQTLKIDKMFIDEIESGTSVMVEDIIRLGHNLNLKIVAEGVEQEYQDMYLKKVGCDSIQGYYYSKPLTLNQLEHFLQQNVK